MSIKAGPSIGRQIGGWPWFTGHSAYCLLLFVVGCGPGSAPTRVTDGAYYPLQVGTRWDYRGAKESFAVVISKHEIIGGIPCALVQTERDGQRMTGEHVYATEAGVFRQAVDGKKLPRPIPILKLPPRQGESWEVAWPRGKQQRTAIFTTSAVAEEVEVPLGKYQALAIFGEIREGGDRTLFKYWFAPEVGLVKQVLQKQGGPMLVYELERFKKGL